MTVPTNPDLPLSYVRPGTYVFLDFTAGAAGDQSEAISVLLWGEALPGGTQAMNAPAQIDSQGDADSKWGSKSIVALAARAALSTGLGGRMRLYGVGVPANSGGVASKIQIVATGTATASGGANITLGGTQVASVGWSVGDTAATVATALLAALQTLTRCPFTWALANSVEITGTANIKGAVLEDYPLRVDYTKPSTGITFGPGSVTFAVNAVGAGSIVTKNGATTITTSILDGSTPTATATALKASLDADDLPLKYGTQAAGVLPLFFAPGRDCRRTSINVGTSTAQTALITNGIVTDASGDLTHAATLAGVAGAGFPSLTTALTNVHNAGSYGKWACPWFDATTAGTLFSQIDQDGGGGGGQQRGQVLMLTGTAGLVLTGALPAATSPAMTTSPQSATRGAVAWCPDAAQPGYELTARLAAQRASVASPFTNYDGLPIPSSAECPALAPAQAAQPSDSSINSAIRDFGLTPLTVKAGALAIEYARSTSLSPDRRLWDWCYIDQRDDHRRDIKTDGPNHFAGCALVTALSQVSSEKDIDIASVVAWLRGWQRTWQAAGTFDNALAATAAAQISPGDRHRCDATYDDFTKIPLHTLGVISQNTQPPL